MCRGCCDALDSAMRFLPAPNEFCLSHSVRTHRLHQIACARTELITGCSNTLLVSNKKLSEVLLGNTRQSECARASGKQATGTKMPTNYGHYIRTGQDKPPSICTCCHLNAPPQQLTSLTRIVIVIWEKVIQRLFGGIGVFVLL